MKRVKMLLSALLAVTVLLSQFTLTSFAATTKNLTEDFANFSAGTYGKSAYQGTSIKVSPVNQQIRYYVDGATSYSIAQDDSGYVTLEGYQEGLSKIQGLFPADGELQIKSSKNRTGFGAVFSGLDETISADPSYIAAEFDFRRSDSTATYEIALNNGVVSSNTTNNLRFLQIKANGNVVWYNDTSTTLCNLVLDTQYKISVFGTITSAATNLHLIITNADGDVVKETNADLGACSIAVKGIGIFNNVTPENLNVNSGVATGYTTTGSVYIDNLALKTYPTAADMTKDEMAALGYEFDADGNYVVYSENFDNMIAADVDSTNKAGFNNADFTRGGAELVNNGSGKAVKFTNTHSAAGAFNIERSFNTEALYDFDMITAATAGKVEGENIEISGSYCFDDFNFEKSFILRGNKTDNVSDQTTYATIKKTDGSLFFGGNDTGINLTEKTWYTIAFKLNIKTGYCTLSVTNEADSSVVYNSASDKMLNVHDFYDAEKRVVEHKFVRTGFSLAKPTATTVTSMTVDNFTVKVLKDAVANDVVCSGFGINDSNQATVTLYTTNTEKVQDDTQIILAAYNDEGVLVGAKLLAAPITTTANTSYTFGFDEAPDGADTYKAYMFDGKLTPMVYAKSK